MLQYNISLSFHYNLNAFHDKKHQIFTFLSVVVSWRVTYVNCKSNSAPSICDTDMGSIRWQGDDWRLFHIFTSFSLASLITAIQPKHYNVLWLHIIKCCILLVAKYKHSYFTHDFLGKCSCFMIYIFWKIMILKSLENLWRQLYFRSFSQCGEAKINDILWL
jgi:hypothetical protein